jgi:hypothetical protein
VVDQFRAQFSTELTRVGTITSGRALQLVQADGSQIPLSPQAFDHFQR